MVYSVPGSGTRFACQLLTDVFEYRQVTLHGLSLQPVSSRTFAQCHVNGGCVTAPPRPGTDIYPALRRLDDEGVVVVIPLRAPLDTVISRIPRNPVVQMLEMWRRLGEFVDTVNHVLLPLETPESHRLWLLEHMATKLNAFPDPDRLEKMAREWPRVGASKDTRERLEYDPELFDEPTEWYRSRLSDLLTTY